MNSSEVGREERAAFEDWYVTHIFDLSIMPVGSRECDLQWRAWQARAALRSQPTQEPQREIPTITLYGPHILLDGRCLAHERAREYAGRILTALPAAVEAVPVAWLHKVHGKDDPPDDLQIDDALSFQRDSFPFGDNFVSIKADALYTAESLAAAVAGEREQCARAAEAEHQHAAAIAIRARGRG